MRESGGEGLGIRRDLVVRRRLLDKLDERFRCALTTVEGGAGFGKTSLLSQAMAEAEGFDRSDDVIVTCRAERGGLLSSDVALAEVARGLGCDPTPESVADAILSAAPRPVVLWIDDVHHVGDAEAFDRLLDVLPTNGHLVLLGRRLPRMSTARLELQGLVCRLSEEDMRFDLDERESFLHLRGADSAVGSTEEASGWPAVMELELAVGRSGAADYLAEEVLGDLGPDRLKALRILSHAAVIDYSMVQAVTDYRGTVDELVGGIPLVTVTPGIVEDSTATDAVDSQIVLHDLLRQALRAGLDEAETSAAIKSIAMELMRRGDLAAAARRLAAIRDIDGLEEVATRLLEDLHVATHLGDRMEVVRAVGEVLGEAPVSLALTGVTLAVIEPLHAEPALKKAIAAAKKDGRHDLVALCTIRLADHYYARGRRAALDELRSELGALAEAGQPAAQRMDLQLDIWSLRLAGRETEIVERVDARLEAVGDDALDEEMRAIALAHRTLALAYSGRIHEALAEVDHHTKLLPPGLFADRMRGFTTIQLWTLGEQSDEVRQQAVRLVDQIERRGQTHLFVGGAATTAIFAASVGELAAAEELVERAARGAAVLPQGTWAHHALAEARAVVQLLGGDELGAAETLEQAIPHLGPDEAMPCHIFRLTGALSYVLVPRSRPAWENQAVGDDLAIRLEVAQALVAFRESGDARPAAALPWADGHLLRPWALGPHLAELAVAAVAGGNRDAGQMLADTRHDSIEVLERLEQADDRTISGAARQAIQVSPRRPAAVVELGLLGPLSVRRAGVEESDSVAWRRARVRDLVSLLAYEGSTSRQMLAGKLWPDKSEKAAQNNLRSNLSYLLNALEPGRTGARPSWFVTSVGDSIRLDGGDYLVLDVERFESLRASAVALDSEAPRKALARHMEACALYRGDLLAGSGMDDLVYFDALRLRGDYTASATRAADLLVSMGEPDQAEDLARRAATIEPLHEPLQRALVAALLAQRRFGAARDVLGTLLAELAQLGIPPEPETVLHVDRLGLEPDRP